jgi:uncharacterized repeat protein (TIGR03803 family)
MTRRLLSPSYLLSLLVVASLAFVAPDRASAGNELMLHSFNPESVGLNPQAGLIPDAEGNLYGVTSGGGTYNEGTAFEFVSDQHGGWSQHVLYNFRGGDDGWGPEAGLIFDAAGNLYGTTIGGGPAGGCLFGGCGTVFELQHNPDGSWTKKVLHGFDSADGEDPQSGVIFDQNGNLYGVTSAGGPHSGGVVYQLSPSADGQWIETVLHSFIFGGGAAPPPNSPVGSLVIDQAGNLFGVTAYGGNACSGGCGTIYALSPGSGGKWAITILHEFAAGSDGAFPSGGLITDKDGNLYGVTFDGGGGTGAGCNYGCGTVYQLSRGGGSLWQETVLYSFQGNSDGSVPKYSLTFDSAGNLYGATEYGGGLGDCLISSCGTVFELTLSSGGQWNENVLWRFDAISSGGQPSSGVVVSASGQLFGETFLGENVGQDGTVFALIPVAGQWSLSTISGFAQSDGWFPEVALVADSKNNLYGTTAFGGAFGIGAVFELTFARGTGWNERMIYSFNNGGHRSGGGKSFTILPSSLIVDVAGNLYGETEGGGPTNAGLVYELSPAPDGTWTEKTLYTFPGGISGVAPSGGLVMDQAGNLYGTTRYGGLGTIKGSQLSGYGIIFELTPAGNGAWTEQTLYLFAGYPTDGAQSEAGLILDPSGNLYGTTSIGGSGNCVLKNNLIIGCGTAFELTLQNGAWRETILHSFLGGTQDGQTPAASLVLDQSGNLFGTTIFGGSGYTQSGPSGTVFELSPAAGGGWNESLLFEFPDANGQDAPLGSLIIDASGNLYSTTSGASGVSVPAGGVFELSPNSSGGWDYQELYSFTNLVSGGSPEAGVIFGPSGYLYGTTLAGGNSAAGSVFAITR